MKMMQLTVKNPAFNKENFCACLSHIGVINFIKENVILLDMEALEAFPKWQMPHLVYMNLPWILREAEEV